MLRKREKFIKNWMPIYFVVAAIVIMSIGFDVFFLAAYFTVAFAFFAFLGYYFYNRMKLEKSRFKTAYRYYLNVRTRLLFKGYNVKQIFRDPEGYVSSLNYRLLQMTKGENELTSIDIATAIIHSIVAEDDEKEFMFDVFSCVKDMLKAPKKYRVSFAKDGFVIEDVIDLMEKADIDKYIRDVGAYDFMEYLKNMFVNDPSLCNKYLWYAYENALD